MPIWSLDDKWLIIEKINRRKASMWNVKLQKILPFVFHYGRIKIASYHYTYVQNVTYICKNEYHHDTYLHISVTRKLIINVYLFIYNLGIHISCVIHRIYMTRAHTTKLASSKIDINIFLVGNVLTVIFNRKKSV